MMAGIESDSKPCRRRGTPSAGPELGANLMLIPTLVRTHGGRRARIERKFDTKMMRIRSRASEVFRLTLLTFGIVGYSTRHTDGQTIPANLQPGGVRQFQAHGLQRRQAVLDGRGGRGQQLRLNTRWGLRARPARAGLRWRQLNQTPGVQLQEQRAGRHVFESASPVAPVPKFAQMTRKRRAMPVGMLRD